VEPATIPKLVASCDIDHSVPPSLTHSGGRLAALTHLDHFLANSLRRYGAERNNPSAHATSGLSPYLRYGIISSLEIALSVESYGRAHNIPVDEFLEELIVRRELAFNFARYSEDPASLTNLPDWARNTLAEHDADPREPCYSREQFEHAQTHDPLWNATQMEMRLRGKIHGYYRMYWGKKIIEWARSHQEALDTMIYIHDRYALDGRDPNTYAGILWCFGLHDRPWRKRPVFGSIRFMSFDGMKRKTDIESYIQEIRYLRETGEDPHRIQ
jgi:deoxyribodipyrimidine photo-lyase